MQRYSQLMWPRRSFFTFIWPWFISVVVVNELCLVSVSAVDYFSSVFSTVLDFAKQIGKTFDAAIEKDCVYKCSNGKKPRPNRYHVPQADGCGVAGLRIPNYVPTNLLEKCCDKHDICYGTCNEKQQVCDAEFKDCLYEICSSLKKYISDDLLKGIFAVSCNRPGCKLVAKTMYMAVTAMGCKYFLAAQEEACVCYDSRDEF